LYSTENKNIEFCVRTVVQSPSHKLLDLGAFAYYFVIG